MNQIVPFESSSVPALFAGLFPLEKLGNVTGGYPIISIKGKIFTKVSGDDREILKKPGEDDPASSIQVVILKQNPHDSKVYYKGNYTEGSDEKPLCYSNNGLTPEADAVAPQSKSCAVCPHNQWGSRISDNGGKGKSCADSRRIAVAALGLPNDPMLIRIPAASLKAYGQYGDSLVKRKVPYQLVVTQIGFDYSVAHPALTFKALGMVDEGAAQSIVESASSSVVDRIVGLIPSERSMEPRQQQEEFSSPAPEVAPVVVKPATVVEGPSAEEVAAKVAAEAKAVKLANAKAAAAKALAEAAALEAEEEEPVVVAPVEAAPVAKPKPAVVVEVSGDLASEIESALGGLDFDD